MGFDSMEGWGMRAADRVVVNSNFTRGVVEGIWGWLRQGKGEGEGEGEGVGIVYPCVHVDEGELESGEGAAGEKVLWKEKKVVLSINRFERKKGIELALRAFAMIGEREKKGTRLVIAGLFFVLFLPSLLSFFRGIPSRRKLILQQVDTILEFQKTLPTTTSWKPWLISSNFITPPPET